MEINKLVRPNILALKPYSSARSEFKGQADVFLDANENPFETGLNRYPDPLQWAVKERISKIKQVPQEQIFLGNGSDEVIDLLIRIFCEPGQDEILILPPTYGMYKVSADIANVAIKRVSLTPDFQPDPAAILKATGPHTKILFLCSPNNPTGNTFKAERIQAILDKFPGIVAIDEAYIDFSDQASWTHQLAHHPNLVVMQTFSKAWGLAGIRLGMAFANAPIIQLLNKVKPPYNVNQLTQKAALQALEKEDQQAAWVMEILKGRSALKEQLAAFPFVEHIFPSSANFLLVRVQNPNELYQFLIEKGIIVRNRSKVRLCEGCLRITVGQEQENQNLLTALQQYASIPT